jgi:hypothetical protein
MEQERIKLWKRTQRVKEIDALIQLAQKQLLQLACEQDLLQQCPNPLWNYTASRQKVWTVDNNPNRNNDTTTSQDNATSSSDRVFDFPSPDLVDEYIETLFITGRLIHSQ